MQGFRQLAVWQKGHELSLAVYRNTRGFPREEQYGLTSQMRRAAVSIAANVAEGSCRSGDTEFERFLQIAMGSASELEYYFLLSRDLGLLDPKTYEGLAEAVEEVKRMLASFIRRLRMDNVGRPKVARRQPKSMAES